MIKQEHKFPYNWTLKDAVFTKDKGKVFSCFACGGGSTMGYKLAGFDVLGCNEIDPKMIEAYKTNHNPKYAYLEPIQTFKLRKDLPKELYDLDILDGSPPCTHLTLSGAKHFAKKRESGIQEEGLRFFFEIWKVSDAVENPMGIINGGKYIKEWFPELHKEMTDAGFTFKPTQIIQPWQFGHKAQKTTCLWLKSFPELKHTGIVDKGEFYISPSGKKMATWSHDATDINGKKIGYNTPEIKVLRSKTFPGIAKAMAEQWTTT